MSMERNRAGNHRPRGGGAQFNDRTQGFGQGTFGSQGFQPTQSAGFATKTRFCREFQQDRCTRANCQNTHAYSLRNDLNKVTRLMCGWAADFALITETQVAVAVAQGLQVMDLASGQQVAAFSIPGQIVSILFAAFQAGPSFLLFGGVASTNSTGMLGSVNCQDSAVAAISVELPGKVSDMLFHNQLLFTGGSDGTVNVWFLQGTQILHGTAIVLPSDHLSPITRVCVIGNFLLVGTMGGFIFGWQYDFSTQATPMGRLEPSHQAPVTALAALDEQFLFSAGEDGFVNCWDAASNWAGGNLVSPFKQPVKFTCLDLLKKGNRVYLIVGDERGNVKLHDLRPKVAKFLYQISLHQRPVLQLKKYISQVHNIVGFMTASDDGSVVLMKMD